jgi:bifunctional non-homologous end joining protein LigD
MSDVPAVDEPWQPLPERVVPMLAMLGSLPSEGEDERWGFEMKWDGVRALARVQDGNVRLISRNDIDMSVSYPELAPLGAAVAGRQLLLDGEIVSFGAAGRPSFKRLQKRMHVADPAAASQLARSDPAVLLVFDLLHADGRSLLRLPYRRRRELLEDLALTGQAWQTPPAFAGGGSDAVAVCKDQGLEGVVAKRLASAYLPGRRSPDWIKVKNLRTQEVVVGGWTPGNGRRAGMIGALLLGIPDAQGRLSYVGKCGAGFSGAVLRELAMQVADDAVEVSPFLDVPRADARDARWVTPRLVGEVVFSEWTADGRLRHPAWRGLRDDKRVDQVRQES